MHQRDEARTRHRAQRGDRTGIDLATEAAIEQHTTGALHELVKGGALVLVLAQRLSTLRAADQIIVVNDHRVTHQGTHAELLEQSELYRHLNYLWFASMH